MAVSHIYNQTYQGIVGATNTVNQVFTGNWETNGENAALGIGTNVAVPFSMPTSGLKQFTALLISGAALDIYVNAASSGSPDLHISLTTAKPSYVWNVNCGFANPFPNPVTTLYMTNAGIVGYIITSVFL